MMGLGCMRYFRKENMKSTLASEEEACMTQKATRRALGSHSGPPGVGAVRGQEKTIVLIVSSGEGSIVSAWLGFLMA
jgi:hypothetical protein